jgi:GNAT superfamily N-acetyltransferase
MPARNLQFRHSRAICSLRSKIFLASGVLATPTVEGARKTNGCYETSSVAVPRLVCLLSTATWHLAGASSRCAIPWLEHMWWFQRVDALPVWSISCFCVRRSYRRQRAMTHLVFAALKAAKRAGAAALEAYPIDTDVPNSTSNTFAGTVATFARAGFKEVARRAPARPIMRPEGYSGGGTSLRGAAPFPRT